MPTLKELRDRATQLFKAAKALEGDGAERLALLFRAMAYEHAADELERKSAKSSTDAPGQASTTSGDDESH